MKVGVSLFAQNDVDWDRFEAEEAGADKAPQLTPDAAVGVLGPTPLTSCPGLSRPPMNTVNGDQLR